MKSGKHVALWILAVFFGLSSLVFLPSIFSIFALIITILVIPIEKWQTILSKYIKGKLKIFTVIALVILCLLTVPPTDSNTSTEPESTTPAESTSEQATIAPTTEPTMPPHTHNFTSVASSTPRTCSCGFSEIMPTAIHIFGETTNPHVEDTGIFTATFEPSTTSEQSVEWSSSQNQIIEVDKNGAYTALAPGKTTITATHPSGIQGTLEVEVLPALVKSIAITSNWDTSKEFKKGDKLTLAAETLPQSAINKKITWKSSDTNVAKVSEKGVVTAVFAGNATISAVSDNGISATFDINVAPSPQKFKVTYTLKKKSTNHVGSSWTKGFEFNGEKLKSGKKVSIMPGEAFTICGWAQENDKRPDYDSYDETITLTPEMCAKGFTIESDFYVTENSGRYSGCSARWHLKVTFKPV